MKFLVKRLGDESQPHDVQFERVDEQLFDDISQIDPQRNFMPVQSRRIILLSIHSELQIIFLASPSQRTMTSRPSGIQNIHPHLNQPFYILYVVVPDYLFTRWGQKSELDYAHLQLPGHYQFEIKEQWVLEIPLTKLALLTHDAPDLPVDIVPPAKKPKLETVSLPLSKRQLLALPVCQQSGEMRSGL